jgi:hypothetical protein
MARPGPRLRREGLRGARGANPASIRSKGRRRYQHDQPGREGGSLGGREPVATDSEERAVRSFRVADLLISRVAPGVARVRSTDPFDVLEIHRIERSQWKAAPDTAGIYLLHGTGSDGKLTVYIGMSRTSIRSRIHSHHVNPAKNWFGVLFAIPVASPVLCPAIEAELIGQLNEAGVVDVVANVAAEQLMKGSDDVHVEPAVKKICDALQLMLGSDIFVATDAGEKPADIDAPLEKVLLLARAYKRAAAPIANRGADDPADATHRWVGAGILAWGYFLADEPDKRFVVLTHSAWRRANPDPEAVTHATQQKVKEDQDELVASGALDEEELVFIRNQEFANWTAAARIVGGKGTYSGAYHWQRLS